MSHTCLKLSLSLFGIDFCWREMWYWHTRWSRKTADSKSRLSLSFLLFHQLFWKITILTIVYLQKKYQKQLASVFTFSDIFKNIIFHLYRDIFFYINNQTYAYAIGRNPFYLYITRVISWLLLWLFLRVTIKFSLWVAGTTSSPALWKTK